VRALVALVAIAAAVSGGAIFYLERLSDDETLRRELVNRVREDLGVELELGDLDVRPLTSSVALSDATLRLPAGRALHVSSATFAVALLPLLAEKRADVESLAVDGPITLRSSDATLAAVATGRVVPAADGSWHLELAGSLETGGTFELVGQRNGAETQLVASFAGVDPAPWLALEPSLDGRADELAGRFDGRFELTSRADATPALEASLRSENAKLRAGDVRVDGPVEISATLDWSGAFPVGPFEIDATRADVDYSMERFRASAGRGVRLRGVLFEEHGSIGVGEVHLSASAFRGQIERE